MALDNLHFLACRDCGELYPLLGPSGASLDATDVDSDDPFKAFLTRHRNHQIVCLWRRDAEVQADRPFWDPMATLTFEVTDGDRSYVVRAARQSIEGERVYQFLPGTLEVGNAEVQIDACDLRRGLDLQFYPHSLRPSKVDRFLASVHELIDQIDPHHLVIEFDAADDPQVSIATIPEQIFDDMLARCGEIFDPWELPRVVDFLRDNREADGLLALRVRRHVTALSA
jgi:hypothetical protein